mmetsp:Transcript_101938/g.283662  ORF Transcript_101938/g.283662 Transcript_101938/m.283662 type:complete len:318 (+) Transcript_101938:1125-2078(+)
MEPRHQRQVWHPLLARQAPPELRVVRPASDDAASLHARDQVKKCVGIHVGCSAGMLVTVRLLALDGPQEVERHDAPAPTKRREELGRNPRKLVAVLDEDGQHLVIPAQPRHHRPVEEELNKARRDRGALRPAPGVRVILDGDLSGTPAEDDEGHRNLCSAHVQLCAPKWRDASVGGGQGLPMPTPLAHAVHLDSVEQCYRVGRVYALTAGPIKPQADIPAKPHRALAAVPGGRALDHRGGQPALAPANPRPVRAQRGGGAQQPALPGDVQPLMPIVKSVWHAAEDLHGIAGPERLRGLHGRRASCSGRGRGLRRRPP